MYVILKNKKLSEFEFDLETPKNLPRNVDFISGTVIEEKLDASMVFTTDAPAGTKMLDFKRGAVPLMSKRFVELLVGAGVDNLQLFPAIVKSKVDETIWEDYFAVNVLGLIACADLSKSTYNEIIPGSYRFRELSIDVEKINDALLFRLQEDSPTLIMHSSVGRYLASNDPNRTLSGWGAEKIIQ